MNEKTDTLLALYQKGLSVPIGIFDSEEALKKGISEFKALVPGASDDRLYIMQFGVNKVMQEVKYDYL